MTAEVKVKITADGSQVGTAVGKVKKDLAGVKDSSDVLSGALAKVGGVLAGAFAVSRITGFLSTVNQAADQLNDLSGRLNAGAAELQVLQIAAQQAGGSTEAMNTALAKMSVSLGDALNGSKPANEALQQLGLSARNLANLKTDEAMQRIGTALSGVGNDYQRAAIAQTLFGKGSSELAQLFREFPGMTGEVNSGLEEMGAKLDKLDTAKIGVMNDELAFQSTVVQNLGIKFLSGLAPSIGVATATLGEMISRIGGASTAGQGFGVVMTAAVKIAETAVYGLAASFEFLRGVIAEALATMLNGAKGIPGPFGTAFRLVTEAAKAISGTTEAANDISRGLDDISKQAFLNAQKTGQYALSAATQIVKAGEIFAAAQADYEAKAAAAAARKDTDFDPNAARPGVDGKTPNAKAGPSFYDGLKATSLVVSDPLTDPEYLMQQALGTALLDLRTQQAAEHMNLVDQTNSSILDSFLLNNDFMIAAEQAKNATLGDGMTSLVGMALQQGGALGKAGKALAIAQTVWSTGQAIMKAMAEVPWPANLAAAANIAGMGVAQLANIKRTNVGGGGSVVAGRGGGASASTPALSDSVAATSPREDTKQSAVNIYVSGNLLAGQESVRWFAEQIGDLVNGNDLVFINGASRQAMELRG